MKRRTHSLIRIAAALAAAAIIVPAAQAGHAQPLRRGVSDFRLSPNQVLGQRQIPASTLRRGVSDFGLPRNQAHGAGAAVQVEVPRAGGFDWADAGIGAAVMLGIMLLVGGLGAGLLLARNHRRELRSA